MRKIIFAPYEEMFNTIQETLKSMNYEIVSDNKILGEICAERKKTTSTKFASSAKVKFLRTSEENETEVDITIKPKSFMGKAQVLGETIAIFHKFPKAYAEYDPQKIHKMSKKILASLMVCI